MLNRLEQSYFDQETKEFLMRKINGIIIQYFSPHDLIHNNFYPKDTHHPRMTYGLIDKFYKEIEMPKDFHSLVMMEWMMNFNSFSFLKRVEQLQIEPSDRFAWETKSPTSNIPSYVTSWNMILVPIGLLSEPFYSKGKPVAVNFASMGFVLAHELAHSLDTTSRENDVNGDRVNEKGIKIWNNETLTEYVNRTTCLVTQYDKYMYEKMQVNGGKTLNENFADNMGLDIALEAFNLYRKEHPEESQQRLPKELRGFSPEQLFFISFANVSDILMIYLILLFD